MRRRIPRSGRKPYRDRRSRQANNARHRPVLRREWLHHRPFGCARRWRAFHYYWDKEAKGSAIKEGSNTWEAILGAEWDINSKWLVSAGVQRTQYGFADADISDLNYNINSTALCIGGAYKFNDRMKLNVGYMHSFYGEHNVAGAAAGMNDIYTRKNDAVGVSFDIRF